MVTLFNSALQEDFSKKMVDYAQGILDVTAYNRALLSSVSPKALDLPDSIKAKAGKCYDDAITNANRWIQKIARDCKFIPQCIVNYQYLFEMSMNSLKSELEELKIDPQNKDLKASLDETLTILQKDFSVFISEAENQITNINNYYKNAKEDKENFTKLVEDVANAIALDENLKKEIEEKINSTNKELQDAKGRLLEADLILENPVACIIIAVATLGIAIVITCIKKELAEQKIREQEKLLNEYTSQFQEKVKAIAALTLAQTSYKSLCTNIEALILSSNSVINVWKDLKNRLQIFADKIASIDEDTDKKEIKKAIDAVKELEENWNNLYNLSCGLSKLKYEIVVEESKAA